MSFLDCKPFEYNGFVLIPEFRFSRLVEANCDEIAFHKEGVYFDEAVAEFKKKVDEVLGNKLSMTKKVEIKVDYSALYPYFDTLANEELPPVRINIPIYVKQQLQNIHELFEGVLDLTLEEVKTLYFERKMINSKVISEKEDCKYITKKVRELCLGDEVIVDDDETKAKKIIRLMNVFPEKVRFDWEDGYALFDLEAEVKILKE